MSETAELKTLTSEEIVAITRQTNYGTWRFQKTWKPIHIQTPRAAGSPMAQASATSISARS
jgi:hypothetical protein